jgi:hypothetical protein
MAWSRKLQTALVRNIILLTNYKADISGATSNPISMRENNFSLVGFHAQCYVIREERFGSRGSPIITAVP